MIEGINSSIATASLLRPAVEQETNARAQSASIEPVQQLARAPYVSPYIFVNNTYNKAVLQIRDAESGDVVRQIPSDTQLRAYSQASAQPAPAKRPEPVAHTESPAPAASAPVHVSTASSAAASSDANADVSSDTETDAATSVAITA